jgi:hypothetical protein
MSRIRTSGSMKRGRDACIWAALTASLAGVAYRKNGSTSGVKTSATSASQSGWVT